MPIVLRFFTKGSGSNGRGPGIVGSMVLDKAGEIIELSPEHAMVRHFRASDMVEELDPREIPDEEEIPPEPVISEEDKRQRVLDGILERLKDLHPARLRSAAGVAPQSKEPKTSLIEMVMEKVKAGDKETLTKLDGYFNPKEK